MIRMGLHLVLHAAAPAVVARFAERRRWVRLWLVMMATQLVDLDHLLANPVFDSNRCSLGFHPLHTYPAFLAYVLLCLIPATRWVGIGLVIHMLLDGMDCLLQRLC